jgi:hypothetical protein
MRDIFESKSFLKLLIEVILIGLGVFLALFADQWRENRQHRQNAQEILRYFREEIASNQDAVKKERAYHEKVLQDIQQFENSNAPKTLTSLNTNAHVTGMHPITFEHTALDLALANQSLSYLPPRLAYAISRVYTRQQDFQTLQTSFLQSAISPTAFTGDEATGLIKTMESYLIDVNIQEPQLLQLYGDLLPQIDAAISHKASAHR